MTTGRKKSTEEIYRLIKELQAIGSDISVRVGGSWTEPNRWIIFPTDGYIEGSEFGPERISCMTAIKASLRKYQHFGRLVEPETIMIGERVRQIVAECGFSHEDGKEDSLVILI